MPGRSVNAIGARRGDFGWSLENIEGFLNQFDLVVTNLESPVISDCPVTDEGMIFCANQAVAGEMVRAGIDVYNLSNNHIYNQGLEGAVETEKFIEENGAWAVSEGEMETVIVGGQSLGFLAYDEVSAPLETEKVMREIATAAGKVDQLLVSFHYGREYNYYPTERQMEISRLAVENGAVAVLGNHSHWLGQIEIYQNVPIIYSHGNFIFDQMWSEQTREGIMVALNFTDAGELREMEIYPNYITDYGLANLATDEKAVEILERVLQVNGAEMAQLSKIEGQKIVVKW